MSEFELGLLRQRARAAIDAMVARGAVIHAVPIGYVRTDDQRCDLDPNLEIQEAIRRVFVKFQELGTARQVMLWHREEQVALPARTRGSYGPVRWELPTYSRILQILTNPTYSGAFVRGRTRTATKMVNGRARKVSERVKDPEAWQVRTRSGGLVGQNRRICADSNGGDNSPRDRPFVRWMQRVTRRCGETVAGSRDDPTRISCGDRANAVDLTLWCR